MMSAKRFVPPILYDLVRGPVKSYLKENDFFYGNFSTWEEANAVAKGYDLDVVINKVKNATLKVKNGEIPYSRDSVEFSRIEYSWPLLSGLLWVAARNKNNLNVLDFGGSFGTTFFQNRKFFNAVDGLKWNIVEQDKYIPVGKQYFEDSTLRFYGSVEKCLEQNMPDVLVLSGVLHYIQDVYAFLNYLLKFKINVVIIDCTLVADSPDDIIKIQKVPAEYFGGEFICRFLSIKKIMKVMIDNNYKLLEEFDGYTGGRVLQGPRGNGFSKGFIFELTT